MSESEARNAKKRRRDEDASEAESGGEDSPVSEGVAKRGKKRSKANGDAGEAGLPFPQSIQQAVTSTRRTRRGADGKELQTLGNAGGRVGDLFVMTRNGEYEGVAIRLLEDFPPLFTDGRVIRAVEALEASDFAKAAKVLWLEKHMAKGVEVVHATVAQWLRVIGHAVPEQFLPHLDTKLPDDVERRLKQRYSQPVMCAFEIAALGANEFGSVLPESWIGRRFDDAEQCHSEMDKLPWRKGKPPVKYCITPGLLKEDQECWQAGSAGLDAVAFQPAFVIGHVENAVVLEKITDEQAWRIWRKSNAARLDDKKRRILWRSWKRKGEGMVVVTDLQSDESRRDQLVRGPVSRLVSTLQKAIRRGRENWDLARELVEELANCKPYYLPDQQFLRVSPSRQLCWRLFIITIEDACPYLPSPDHYLSLPELFVLAIICNADPEFILPRHVIGKLATTAQRLAFDDRAHWEFRDGAKVLEQDPPWRADTELPRTVLTNAMLAAQSVLPMMAGDRRMLSLAAKLLNADGSLRAPKHLCKLPAPAEGENPSKEETAQATRLAGVDMHCFPNLILHVQAALPPRTMTTHQISGYIWDNLSRINVRKGPASAQVKDATWVAQVQEIQRYYLSPPDVSECAAPIPEKPSLSPENGDGDGDGDGDETGQQGDEKLAERLSRTAFVLLFSQPVAIPKSKSYPRMEVMAAGASPDDAFVVRESQGDKRQMRPVEDEDQRQFAIERYFELTRAPRSVDVPRCRHFRWKWDEDKQGTAAAATTTKTVMVHTTPERQFVADGIATSVLDGSAFMSPLRARRTEPEMPKTLRKIVRTMVGKGGWVPNLFCRNPANRLSLHYDWTAAVPPAAVSPRTWASVYTHLHRDLVEFGPVTRSGDKLKRAVSYADEGYQWRIFNLFSLLYPDAVSPQGQWKFAINQCSPSFVHLLAQVRGLVDRVLCDALKPAAEGGEAKRPRVKTKLWAHQEQSVRRMVDGFLAHGKKGFGDASHVGAGKTLIALAAMAKLFRRRGATSGGFLVLVPNRNLVRTWQAEIQKHTKGFHVTTQNANGSLTDPRVLPNTIVISTMGRCRDHPLAYPWVLVVVDECLSVQNAEALQTEEAWRQALVSKFGVLMLSATFFRSKFEKLFYMLEMLQSDIPATKPYLDVLLSEHILCHLQSDNPRVWTSNVHKFALSAEQRREYQQIQRKGSSDNKELYGALCKFIHTKVDYPALFLKRLGDLGDDCKCLMFAQSKAEAERIAGKAPSEIGLYPDISKTHVVVSYTLGTYGLNDLVGFNTVLTRPPEPDKLPQMKGRLDRNGQECNSLRLEMILLADTVEETWLLRLEMATYFYRHHIMPLAQFYEMAVRVGSE